MAQTVKESAFNAGDPGSIPGSRRSPEIDKPLQYPWCCKELGMTEQLMPSSKAEKSGQNSN